MKSNNTYTINSNGCWIWQGRLDKDGYPRMNALCIGGKRKPVSVHKYNYEYKYGKVAAGLVIDHTCLNILCVNPDHMEAITQTENVRRGKATELSIDIARDIRKLYSDGEYKQYDIAKIYNIHPARVSDIINNRKWREDEEINPQKTAQIIANKNKDSVLNYACPC